MASPSEAPPSNRLLVEVSFEVCWQLGGIYTVLRSKAPMAVKRHGQSYCLVGPYNEATADDEFEPLEPTGLYGRAAQILNERGIGARYGRWMISGKPQVVLLDYRRHFDRLNDDKYFLWKDHFIETYSGDSDVDEVVVFGYLVVEFFEALLAALRETGDEGAIPKVVAHFHEWMSAVPIPELRRRKTEVATVFTTHATILGRYLAADDRHFYQRLPGIDADGAARSRGVHPRYAIERAAAWSATVFTTVSGITGFEAEHFLGRKPDALLPNGLNVQRFTALHEFQNLHARSKKQIHEFVMGHFFPSYSFDLDRTLYVVTSGRYEYGNKGLDLFIESLARLNWRLKVARSDVTVVAFIVTRAPNKGMNVDVLRSQVLFRELQGTASDIARDMSERLLASVAEGRMPGIDDLIDENAQVRLKRMTHAWRKKRWPSIVTHDMAHDGQDAVLGQLRFCNLLNNPEDPVKVIFHPEFLSRTSPLIGLDYDEFVRGCHLGVFPSYYEPWGYTPMECAALGVPAVTSDLAGFGCYVMDKIPDHDKKGMYVLGRRYKTFDESAEELTSIMQTALTMDRRERIDLRNRVEALSVQFDWKELIRYYWEAHALAVERFAEQAPTPGA
ncbi:MAG: glycosyltransferase [Deltaproteobacteria bacterium]|nr:glycosyltransferase [Deltaproteobacteria bacterium]